MTPWTALLESLHSALIDELVERHPEPKPELGMPIRIREFSLPEPALGSALVSEVFFGDNRGQVFLALDEACVKLLSLTQRQLWDAIVRRAGGEFIHRNIRPRLGKSFEVKQGEPLPAGAHAPVRLIWIPFKLGAACCYLGMGV